MMGTELFSAMTQRDQDEFRRVCNMLMSTCFVIKGREKTKKEYYFILSHRKEFMNYLDILGYSLEINEDYGVIQLINRENYNHLRLKLYDSIILLILRILYDEKKRELLLTDVVITTGEIQDKYITLKIRDKLIDKTTMNNALRLFRRYNIVEILDNNLSSEDARILVYDSILMAIRTDDVKKISELIGQYRQEDENDEGTEEAEID